MTVNWTGIMLSVMLIFIIYLFIVFGASFPPEISPKGMLMVEEPPALHIHTLSLLL